MVFSFQDGMNGEGEMGFKEYERNMSFLDLEQSKTLGASRRSMIIPGGRQLSGY